MALSDTAADLAYVRDNIGDTESSAYKLSNATLDAIYASSTQGNGSLNDTVYFALLRLVGIYSREVDSITSPQTGLSYSSSKRYDNTVKQFERWGRITGRGGSGVTMGHSSTNTYRTDSLQTEEPTYLRSDGDSSLV